MSALEGFEDLIRDKIENERWTPKQISTFLMESYPGQRGFSVRSIERFCGNKGIHKTSRIDDRSLDVAVSTATSMVRSILRVDRLPIILHAACCAFMQLHPFLHACIASTTASLVSKNIIKTCR